MSTPIPVTLEQVRRFRLTRSGLLEPFATPEDAAAALAGIQAQILPAAGVALWNRTRGLTHARFEQMLFTERTLVKIWGQRGTLHLYRSEDWPLICAMISGAKSWWGRTAEKEDRYDDYDRLVEDVAAELRRRSALGQTMGRSDLRAAAPTANPLPAEAPDALGEAPGPSGGPAPLDLSDEHLSPWGGVFADLVRRGYACHAGREGEGRFVAREAWLPHLAWKPPDYETANITVLRRYVRAYGPTTCEDFRYWRLAYAEPARRWWSSIEDELVPVTITDAASKGTPAKDRVHYVFADDLAALTAPVAGAPSPLHMLYRFDPLLLGHRDKSWIVPPEHYRRVWRPAGHIEGVLLVAGQAAGTWRYQRKGSTLQIAVQPFRKPSKRLAGQVERTSAQIAAFFGAKEGEVTWADGVYST